MAFDNDDFHAPDGPRTDEFLLRPIRTSDAELDYEAGTIGLSRSISSSPTSSSNNRLR